MQPLERPLSETCHHGMNDLVSLAVTFWPFYTFDDAAEDHRQASARPARIA
jgi:hypothetical protein